MNVLLVALHVIVCIFLIAVVLVQRGKGAEVGAVFGGGASSTVFGSRGAGNFLTKLTTGSAVIFMITSLSLSYLATERSAERLFDDDEAAVLEETVVEEPLFEQLGTVEPEAAAALEADAPPEGASATAAPAAETPGEETPAPPGEPVR